MSRRRCGCRRSSACGRYRDFVGRALQLLDRAAADDRRAAGRNPDVDRGHRRPDGCGAAEFSIPHKSMDCCRTFGFLLNKTFRPVRHELNCAEAPTNVELLRRGSGCSPSKWPGALLTRHLPRSDRLGPLRGLPPAKAVPIPSARALSSRARRYDFGGAGSRVADESPRYLHRNAAIEQADRRETAFMATTADGDRMVRYRAPGFGPGSRQPRRWD